ncbi:hypothetical protein DL767_011327 [Monosporascus sp. MG133]|nr:hypothetical protein DL767_011327 [Monosporascus sp. MG133]
MVTLVSFAAELLYEIFSYLPPSSLVSVCQTCRDLQRFAEPYLYESITWGFYTCYVKAVELCSSASRLERNAALPDIPAPLDIQPLWLDALKQQHLPGREIETFRSEVCKGNPGALMGLLLASLHNLQVLVTDYTMLCQSNLPQVVFKHAQVPETRSYRGSRLLKVKEVTIRNNLDSRIIKCRTNPQIASVFCLRSLERVTAILQRTNHIPWKKTGVASHAKLPTLHTLRLIDHLSSPRTIPELLANAPRLDRFEYFLVENTDELAADEKYECLHTNSWKAFSTALLAVAGSLKTLIISIDEAFTSDYPPETMDVDWMFGISARRGCIGSLQSLRCLTKLEIPMYILLGRDPHITKLRDVLPPSLRKLYLRDDHVYEVDLDNCEPERVIGLLRDYLLGHEHGNMAESPLLEKLRIKLRRGSWASDDDLWALMEMSEEAGVYCTVHLRKSSFLSTEDEVIDEIEELIIYDPFAANSESGAEETLIGDTGYPTRSFNEAARCFESSA